MSEAHELTPEEERWVRRLRRVIADMPPDVWLFADRDLHVMRRGENGEHVMTLSGGVDQEWVLAGILEACEGGGW